MKDILFFAGAAVLAVAMTGAALAVDPRTIPSTPMSVGEGSREVVTVAGQNLLRFRQGRRDTSTLLRQESQPSFLRITSRRNADLPTAALDVTNLPLATDLEVAFAQKELTITIKARSAAQNGSPVMRAQYYAEADANSGWVDFLLTPEWQPYSFKYKPPSSPNAQSLDFLSLWADPDGLGRGVEVREIEFDTRTKAQANGAAN